MTQQFNKQGLTVLGLSGTPGQSSVYREGVASVLQEYNDLFTSELGLLKGPPARICLKKGVILKFRKARTLSYALRDKASQELDRLMQIGVLSPVTHSEWATPIVPVIEKDGSVRTCGYFKVTINPVCAVEQYPLHVIEDMFASLSGGDTFSIRTRM